MYVNKFLIFSIISETLMTLISGSLVPNEILVRPRPPDASSGFHSPHLIIPVNYSQLHCSSCK